MSTVPSTNRLHPERTPAPSACEALPGVSPRPSSSEIAQRRKQADVGLEATLLIRLRAGDQAALGELYDRTATLALALALDIVRDEGEAENVVHDAFVTVWREANHFSGGHSGLIGWLLELVHAAASQGQQFGVNEGHI